MATTKKKELKKRISSDKKYRNKPLPKIPTKPLPAFPNSAIPSTIVSKPPRSRRTPSNCNYGNASPHNKFKKPNSRASSKMSNASQSDFSTISQEVHDSPPLSDHRAMNNPTYLSDCDSTEDEESQSNNFGPKFRALNVALQLSTADDYDNIESSQARVSISAEDQIVQIGGDQIDNDPVGVAIGVVDAVGVVNVVDVVDDVHVDDDDVSSPLDHSVMVPVVNHNPNIDITLNTNGNPFAVAMVPIPSDSNISNLTNHGDHDDESQPLREHKGSVVVHEVDDEVMDKTGDGDDEMLSYLHNSHDQDVNINNNLNNTMPPLMTALDRTTSMTMHSVLIHETEDGTDEELKSPSSNERDHENYPQIPGGVGLVGVPIGVVDSVDDRASFSLSMGTIGYDDHLYTPHRISVFDENDQNHEIIGISPDINHHHPNHPQIAQIQPNQHIPQAISPQQRSRQHYPSHTHHGQFTANSSHHHSNHDNHHHNHAQQMQAEEEEDLPSLFDRSSSNKPMEQLWAHNIDPAANDQSLHKMKRKMVEKKHIQSTSALINPAPSQSNKFPKLNHMQSIEEYPLEDIAEHDTLSPNKRASKGNDSNGSHHANALLSDGMTEEDLRHGYHAIEPALPYDRVSLRSHDSNHSNHTPHSQVERDRDRERVMERERDRERFSEIAQHEIHQKQSTEQHQQRQKPRKRQQPKALLNGHHIHHKHHRVASMPPKRPLPAVSPRRGTSNNSTSSNLSNPSNGRQSPSPSPSTPVMKQRSISMIQSPIKGQEAPRLDAIGLGMGMGLDPDDEEYDGPDIPADHSYDDIPSIPSILSPSTVTRSNPVQGSVSKTPGGYTSRFKRESLQHHGFEDDLPLSKTPKLNTHRSSNFVYSHPDVLPLDERKIYSPTASSMGISQSQSSVTPKPEEMIHVSMTRIDIIDDDEEIETEGAEMEIEIEDSYESIQFQHDPVEDQMSSAMWDHHGFRSQHNFGSPKTRELQSRPRHNRHTKTTVNPVSVHSNMTQSNRLMRPHNQQRVRDRANGRNNGKMLSIKKPERSMKAGSFGVNDSTVQQLKVRNRGNALAKQCPMARAKSGGDAAGLRNMNGMNSMNSMNSNNRNSNGSNRSNRSNRSNHSNHSRNSNGNRSNSGVSGHGHSRSVTPQQMTPKQHHQHHQQHHIASLHPSLKRNGKMNGNRAAIDKVKQRMALRVKFNTSPEGFNLKDPHKLKGTQSLKSKKQAVTPQPGVSSSGVSPPVNDRDSFRSQSPYPDTGSIQYAISAPDSASEVDTPTSPDTMTISQHSSFQISPVQGPQRSTRNPPSGSMSPTLNGIAGLNGLNLNTINLKHSPISHVAYDSGHSQHSQHAHHRGFSDAIHSTSRSRGNAMNSNPQNQKQRQKERHQRNTSIPLRPNESEKKRRVRRNGSNASIASNRSLHSVESNRSIHSMHSMHSNHSTNKVSKQQRDPSIPSLPSNTKNTVKSNRVHSLRQKQKQIHSRSSRNKPPMSLMKSAPTSTSNGNLFTMGMHKAHPLSQSISEDETFSSSDSEDSTDSESESDSESSTDSDDSDKQNQFNPLMAKFKISKVLPQRATSPTYARNWNRRNKSNGNGNGKMPQKGPCMTMHNSADPYRSNHSRSDRNIGGHHHIPTTKTKVHRTNSGKLDDDVDDTLQRLRRVTSQSSHNIVSPPIERMESVESENDGDDGVLNRNEGNESFTFDAVELDRHHQVTQSGGYNAYNHSKRGKTPHVMPSEKVRPHKLGPLKTTQSLASPQRVNHRNDRMNSNANNPNSNSNRQIAIERGQRHSTKQRVQSSRFNNKVSDRKREDIESFQLRKMKTKSENHFAFASSKRGRSNNERKDNSSRRKPKMRQKPHSKPAPKSITSIADLYPDYKRKKETQNEDDSVITWITYRDAVLGKGAFGTVYKAFDKRENKIIAIKEFRFSPRNRQKTLRDFDKETKIMRTLKHQNIVAFKGYKVDDSRGFIYLLMEYVPGNSLETVYQQKGSFSEVMIQKYVYQMVQGLRYAHSKNIIHRDIKGKNILINNKGVIKIADFGNSILTEKDQSNGPITAYTMDFQATPLWTAPEACKGSIDFKYDIWGMGCVIIEMASAKYPWSECKFKTPFNALWHIGQDGNRPEWPKSLSMACQSFIARCLKRNPEERYDSNKLLEHPFLRVVKRKKNNDGYTIDKRKW